MIANEIIERLKIALNLRFDTDLAAYLGLSGTGALSNWKKRNRVNWDLILSKCENVSVQYLRTGKGEPIINAPEAVAKELEFIEKEITELSEITERDGASAAEAWEKAVTLREHLVRLTSIVDKNISHLMEH